MYPFKPHQDNDEPQENPERRNAPFETKTPRSILKFRTANPSDDAGSPRWQIGIDKQQVALYVGIALIAGFGLGYLTLRSMRTAEDQKAQLQNRNEPAASRAKERPAAPVSEFRRVNRVLKGDTIEVEGVGNVRLIGVEAPESKTPNDIYAVQARNALAFTEKILSGQDVRLDFDAAFAAKDNKDISGNTLAYVYTQSGQLVNAELLRQGYVFLRPSETFKMVEDFRSYEREAMTSMRGLWGDSLSATTNPPPATTDSPATAAAGSDPTKRPKLSPLSPNEIGPNIPGVVPGMTAPPTVTTPAAPSEMMVLVSSGDRIYHKKGCELAGGKKTVMPISQARSSGNSACSRCFPSTSIKMQ